MTSLDIVIPVYNEEDVLPLLFKELDLTFNAEALEKHGLETPHYIFVDDGSKDQSKRIIREAIDGGLNASLLSLTRNFGHQSAVTAGLSLSRAQITALIDSDLQDPPQVILEMVDKWRQGYEVIYGVRRQRKEGKIKVFCYWFFYRILSFLSEVDIAKDSGDFCLIDQKVVSTMNKLPEKLRFPRGLRAWVGYKQWGHEYERQERHAGQSKYSFRHLYNLATHGIASMSIRPLKVAQLLCIVFSIVSMVFLVFFIQQTMGSASELKLAVLGLGALISFSSMMTFFVLYVMSAYIGRMYLEVKQRPTFLLNEIYSKTIEDSL